jgi:glycosyltransferase involved in cell wall biosynthesis
MDNFSIGAVGRVSLKKPFKNLTCSFNKSNFLNFSFTESKEIARGSLSVWCTSPASLGYFSAFGFSNETHEYSSGSVADKFDKAYLRLKINENKDINLIVIQHEFGLFSKNDTAFIDLFKNLNKPIIFVFHTIIPHPTRIFVQNIQKMAKSAAAIIVMTQNAAHILNNDYKIHFHKIRIIPHGTHLIKPLNKEALKKKYFFEDKRILSTFGLLSPNKGIDITLNALPSIIKYFPNVLFLILGKT